MPKWKQLPNGKWVAVPSVDSYVSQFDTPISRSNAYWDQFLDKEEEDEGTLAGSLWEGVKSIPSGAADVFLSGAQAAIGIATPWGDLPVERRLREMASKRARERDPAYRDAFLPAVGTGLGQVGVLGGLSAMGPQGRIAGALAGVGMGISDQTRRIADYEQRTGENVPWYMETAAHILGAGIGLTEVLPVQKFLLPKSIRKMSDDLLAGVAPSTIESLLLTGTAEATQEATAQFMQAITARGLYDPDATKDLVHAMAEDFKVGGVVGGLADLATKSILKRHSRGGSAAKTAIADEFELQRANYRYLNSEAGREVAEAVDQTRLTGEIGKILRESGVDRKLGEGILHMYNGEYAVLPAPMDNHLIDGGVDAEFLAELKDEFRDRSVAASQQLGMMAEKAAKEGDTGKSRNYLAAQQAVDTLTGKRINVLEQKLEGMGYGIRRIGGLSESSQYRAARQAEIDTADSQNLFSFQDLRQKAKKDKQPVPSYWSFVKGLLGGSYGTRGYFRSAEVLGVHRGPGTSAIKRNAIEEDGTVPDYTLAASEHASYDLGELSQLLFDKDSEGYSRLGGIHYGDAATSKADIDRLTAEIKQIEEANGALYSEYPIFQELAEQKERSEKRMTAGDAFTDQQWSERRDANSQALLSARGENNAQLANLRRQRNIVYLQVISQRLNDLNSAFFESAQPDITARQEAEKRLGMDADQFKNWLTETRMVVNRNQQKSNIIREKAQEARRELELQVQDMSPEDVYKARARILPQIRAGYLEFPRDISATNAGNLARLFSDKTTEVTGNLDTMFQTRAHADIADWLGRYGLQRKTPSGIPYLDPSLSVVQKFIKKQAPDERAVAIVEKYAKEVGKKREELTDTQVTRAFLKEYVDPVSEEGKATALEKAIEMQGKYEPAIKESDIIELLNSKNILLRGETSSPGSAVPGNLGSTLANRVGTGVKSRPFEQLLADMTGARTWDEAGYSERLLMYSRLLQLAPHRAVSKTGRELDPDPLSTERTHRSIYLPNFYEDPSLNAHMDLIIDNVVEPRGKRERTDITRNLAAVRKNVQKALGKDFDGAQFDEALATVIESGTLVHGGADTDMVDTNPENLPSVDDMIPIAMGEIGTPSNPRVVAHSLGVSEDATGDIPSEFIAISTGMQTSLTGKGDDLKGAKIGDIVTVRDEDGREVTVRVTSSPRLLGWNTEVQEMDEGDPLASYVRPLWKRLWDMVNSTGPVSMIGPNTVQATALEQLEGVAPAKDVLKARIASQFIGEHPPYAAVYDALGKSNTGQYTSNDIVWVASDFFSPTDANGQLQGAYGHLDAAMDARAIVVTDSKSERNKDLGAEDIAQYMRDRGYRRLVKEDHIDLPDQGLLEEAMRDLGFQRQGDPEKGLNDVLGEADSGIWVPMEGAIEWGKRERKTTGNFGAHVSRGDVQVSFELFDPASEPDVLAWLADVEKLQQAKETFLRTGRDPEGQFNKAWLAPWYKEGSQQSRGYVPDVLNSMKDLIRQALGEARAEATPDANPLKIASMISTDILGSIPSVDGWNKMLNQLGMKLSNFPWPFAMDRDNDGITSLSTTVENMAAEDVAALMNRYTEVVNEVAPALEFTPEDALAYEKWLPVTQGIFSEQATPVLFGTGISSVAANQGSHIVIDLSRVKGAYTRRMWKRMDKRGGGSYTRYTENLVRDFQSPDEFLAFVIAHEKAHTALPPGDAGIEYVPGIGKTGSMGDLSYAQYEDIVSNMGLLELDRFMFEQVRSEYRAARREARNAPPPEYNSQKVSLNVNYDRLGKEYSQDEQALLPGTPEAIDRDLETWNEEVKPKKVKALMDDKKLDGPIKRLLDEYNRKNSDKKPLTKRQYIDRFAAHIQSAAGLDQLSQMGLMETIGEKLKTVADRVPVDSILEMEGNDGKTLLKTLIASGAIPSSLNRTTSALRTEYITTVKDRFELLQKNVDRVLTRMRVPDNVRVQFVDDMDGMFQIISDVGITGGLIKDRSAMYDAPGNRIIINLARVDPNDMIDAQEIMKDVAFHEGLHSLLVRDVLTGEELGVLNNYIRNNVVPKEVDEGANGANLTWYERAIYNHKDTNLTEGDMEHEAIISLMESLVQNKVPAAISAGKVRKIKSNLTSLFEGVIGAAKDADITDVLSILAGIEQGRIGERGSGYMGDPDTKITDDYQIRSLRLSRYADPKELAELTKAVALRDAAQTDSMKAKEQAKVDAISDRIVARRTSIVDSAPPTPDDAQVIQNEREKTQMARDTHSLNIPLLGEDTSGNPNAYKEAIDEFMRRRRGEQGYVMPQEYQYFFDNRAPRSSSDAVDLVDEGVKAGVISHIEGDPARKALEDGPLSGKTFSQKELDEPLGKSSVDGMRYRLLDRRQWVVGQTDRILAARNRAQLDAETSALVMWRNADNALNWLPSLMTRGPLSYLGVGTGAGEFDNAPVYDDKLQEKYGGNGRVRGLNEIFEFIMEPKDQEVATLYGVAKRIKWTKERRDEIRRVVGNTRPEHLSPEIRQNLKRFEEAYKKINPKNKFKDAYLDKIIQEIEGNDANSHIIEFWDNYQAFNRAMIKMSYNTGMLTREQRDEWMGMDYAPFYRDVSPIESFPVGTQEGMQQRGVNLVERALEGSQDPVSTDLMNSILENTQALVRDAMQNVAVARTARDSVDLNEGRKIDISNLAAAIDNRVIRVMENGVATYYELDDAELAMSSMMLGFNPKKRLQELFGGQKLGAGMSKALTSTSSWLRESVTRTPPFQVKNIFRDSWNAMILTGGGPGLILSAMRNAIRPDSLRRAEEAGLSIGIDFIAEPGQYGRKMQSELDKKNRDWRDPLNGPKVAWDFLGRIAKQSEIATRVAVYDRVLAKTGDRALAQYLAVEIMNYGRRGANPMLSTYMSTVPFMNGRMQGLDVTLGVMGLTGRGASDIPGTFAYGMTKTEYENAPLWQKHRAKMFSRGLLLSAATGIMYWLMRDDEEWQDLRDETKADNWLLPMSDHAWLKIPIPFEVGVLFKVIPEKIMEAIMEKDVDYRDVSSEVVRQLRTSLSIGGPQLVAPVVNAMRNYDTFRKDAIVSPWMEDGLDPNEQRNAYTSNVARGVADFVNDIPLVNNLTFLTSPMKMEYMMRQYAGTMGSYGIVVADRLARTGVLPSIPYDPLMNWTEAENIVGTNVDFDFESLIGGEGVANVPLLGDLLTDPRTRAGRQQDFYEMINELDEVVATLSSITERDWEKGFEYERKHQSILNDKAYLRYLSREMKKWRGDRDWLATVSRDQMSDDEKREYYQRMLDSRTGILSGIPRMMGELRDARSPLRWLDKD